MTLPFGSMQSVKYRYAEREDKEAILAVLQANAPAIPCEIRSQLFDWQFGGANPIAHEHPSFWLCEVDGVVAGVNGLMPIDLRFEGQVLRAIWSCDTLVSDQYRGLGIGKGLLTQVSKVLPVVLGFGISDLSDPILAKLGWHPYTGVTTHFYYGQEPGLRGGVKNLISAMKSLKGKFFRLPPDIKIVMMTDRFGAAHDSLWRRVASDYDYAVVRNANYLNWRYRDHPVLKYEVHEAWMMDELLGSLVVRYDPHESVIADYLGGAQRDDVMLALVRDAVASLAKRGVARIRCETSSQALKRVLRHAGFIDYPRTSIFRFVVSESLSEKVSDMNWFVMTGDSDNESSQVAKLFERAQR